MRKNLVSKIAGIVITAISLFLLTLIYPRLFALFGLLFVTACVILGLSLIASIPRGLELTLDAIRRSDASKRESAVCDYCGLALPTNSAHCPNCGAPVNKEDKC